MHEIECEDQTDYSDEIFAMSLAITGVWVVVWGDLRENRQKYGIVYKFLRRICM